MSKPVYNATYRRGMGDVRVLQDTGTHLHSLDVPLRDVPALIQALLHAYSVDAIADQLARERS
ncbi:hypothetical protein S2M10_29640 [Sphingomonas sp. S2M10]|uniref:hypothetical protein n=1 Tax=Sphingomonas sp. S2M10 TaxID=2705010 RepID=UPI0014575879|nr:hypothetical protein [Sphingomonas sp. S2M10]NLS27962.1 hypothetical protein [Sphingomonas sp. S2M10]